MKYIFLLFLIGVIFFAYGGGGDGERAVNSVINFPQMVNSFLAGRHTSCSTPRALNESAEVSECPLPKDQIQSNNLPTKLSNFEASYDAYENLNGQKDQKEKLTIYKRTILEKYKATSLELEKLKKERDELVSQKLNVVNKNNEIKQKENMLSQITSSYQMAVNMSRKASGREKSYDELNRIKKSETPHENPETIKNILVYMKRKFILCNKDPLGNGLDWRNPPFKVTNADIEKAFWLAQNLNEFVSLDINDKERPAFIDGKDFGVDRFFFQVNVDGTVSIITKPADGQKPAAGGSKTFYPTIEYPTGRALATLIARDESRITTDFATEMKVSRKFEADPLINSYVRYSYTTQNDGMILFQSPLFHGNLDDLNISLTPEEKIKMTQQAVTAMKTMNEHYAHLDVKPGNFFFKVNYVGDKRQIQIALADFDTAVDLQERGKGVTQFNFGESKAYASPEGSNQTTFEKLPDIVKKEPVKQDLWGAGLVLASIQDPEKYRAAFNDFRISGDYKKFIKELRPLLPKEGKYLLEEDPKKRRWN